MYLRWWLVEQIVNILGKGFFKVCVCVCVCIVLYCIVLCCVVLCCIPNVFLTCTHHYLDCCHAATRLSNIYSSISSSLIIVYVCMYVCMYIPLLLFLCLFLFLLPLPLLMPLLPVLYTGRFPHHRVPLSASVLCVNGCEDR